MNTPDKDSIKYIKNKIFVIDGHCMIYRGFYASPDLHDESGRATGAISVVCSAIVKYLTQYEGEKFCIASDSAGKTFRHAMFEKYKANRKEIDPKLREQIIAMQEIYTVFGLKVLSNHGFEADDYITSLVHKFAGPEENNKYTIFIVTTDKDLMQLVNDYVYVLDPQKDIVIGANEVCQKFGVRPDQIKDYLSLIGDASDNIPGAKGIGPKGAIKILEAGKLDDLIADNFSAIKNERSKKLLHESIDDIKMSQDLVSMKDDLPIEFQGKDFNVNIRDHANEIYKMLVSYGIKGLASRMLKFLPQTYQSLSISNNLVIAHPDKIIEQIRIDDIACIAFHDGKYQILSAGTLSIFDDIAPFKEVLMDRQVKKIFYASINCAEYITNANAESFMDLQIMNYHLMGVAANKDFSYLLNYHIQDLGPLKESDRILYYIQIYESSRIKLLETNQMKFFTLDQHVKIILMQMHQLGIGISLEKLNELGEFLKARLVEIQDKIIYESGYEFNISSPAQTSDVLFNKMGLPTPTKKPSAKSGNFSTDANVLAHLADIGYEIANLILQYRTINKLNTGYVQSLPSKIVNHRIHTHFVLNGAITGRILSENPNLQNIPTRGEDGQKIRQCFSAPVGYKILSLDYSQIELRILAKLANIENMQNAFKNGQDVHKMTASEVFGTPIDQVSDQERSKAKAINFGIIYGISPFGLARQLKIDNAEAKQIIDKYMDRYSEITAYINSVKKFSASHGYVLNMFGRRIYERSIEGEASLAEKKYLERAQINATIQGSAADLIKFAMVRINDYIISSDFSDGVNLLLQIHDELIFEVRDDLLDKIIPIFKNLMLINSIDGNDSGLHLDAGVKIGQNWPNEKL